MQGGPGGRQPPRSITKPGSSVLLLHGSGPGTTGAAWALLAEALAPHHRLIAPDLPGFGEAPAAPIETWLDLLAPDEPCAVVGNSAGGALALKLAAAGRATRVVAVGSMGAPMTIPPALDALWAADDPRAVLELIFAGPELSLRLEGRPGVEKLGERDRVSILLEHPSTSLGPGIQP